MTRLWVALLVASATALAPLAAAERTLTLDPAQTKITFELKATAHTVEGTFALHQGSVRFDPAGGAASGAIEIDLKAGQTGNARRDRKMHAEVLETEKWPLAVLHPEHLKGALPDRGASDVVLTGKLSFHGADHPLELPVHVTRDGSHVTLALDLVIPYVEWGLEDPSVFVLRVGKTVAVHVEASGQLD
jgi:polyisoprenoid-binding protein YceI